MKQIVIGILAHVDAGKTTLSEAMLYKSGSIKKLGRVDRQDAFLDTHGLERERGITIFSKQAQIELPEMCMTLLDTPGHVDFSTEMERSIQVMDYAILVISAAEGVQGHTKTLWRLLKKYKIPVFLFINKMDQENAGKQKLLEHLRKELEDTCVDFEEEGTEAFYENLAVCEEALLEHYLEAGVLEKEEIRQMIERRRIFPCYFGSALKLEGVDAFLSGLQSYTVSPFYPEQFGARVYKIARDEQGMRLTYMKITGGSLSVRTELKEYGEKVNQIRVYSGKKFLPAKEVGAGCICAVTGISASRTGDRLGMELEKENFAPVLAPVLTCRILLPEGCDAAEMLGLLRQLEEEEPELCILWNEKLQEIQIQIMGEVQTEILKSLIRERFGIEIEFDTSGVLYKETIANTVEGVGHFEPLRHYAEVHLLLEPGEAGSGLVLQSNVSTDMLDGNWQRLVISHLKEKEHRGVLTGSPITDMKITLVAGRAHQKHTEGGDFRQAAFRALRQGLMQAETVLLEPYYHYWLTVPEKMVGRAMTDMENRSGSFGMPEYRGEMATLSGSVPVQSLGSYQSEVISYTGGQGHFFYSPGGYAPCHNSEEIVEKIGYQAEADVDNPSGSVFCAHGAGFFVPWNEVKDYMHLESRLSTRPIQEQTKEKGRQTTAQEWIGTEEIDAILARTYHANKRENAPKRRRYSVKQKAEVKAPVIRSFTRAEAAEAYLLVDGYNIIYAWDELRELAESNIDAARDRLLDLLCNYQGIKKCKLIAVFDAYRVKGHMTESLNYHNIHVVYTKEAETADQYIEKFAHENGKKYDITVATSDGLEQIIIRGQGCKLLSARDLKIEMEETGKRIIQAYKEGLPIQKNYLLDYLSEEEAGRLEEKH